MSVFTYDHAPQRVSSPWATSDGPFSVASQSITISRDGLLGGLQLPPLTRLADYSIGRLGAEPENGPVEYKLHLLLRPRQPFANTASGKSVDARARARFQHDSQTLASENGSEKASTPGHGKNEPARASNAHLPSHQSRQNRLQHLTTQLLWRLQQSSPYHASSTSENVVPNLLDAFRRPDKLLPGIEESQGAIYELGVNDDGALVGLTRGEMSESLINLRIMANSLGCNVSILRAVVIGPDLPSTLPINSSSVPAQWPGGGLLATNADEQLLVVEALVLPETVSNFSVHSTHLDGQLTLRSAQNPVGRRSQNTEQLRVCLTGSTTSGKSSLLGTLLASTLDNARGKSRLNLLKHRHERASGMTSSVAHELLGYKRDESRVVNYAHDNIESWLDVHIAAEGGRLVLLTDSAGHPRFRRTIVRSLVAWQPHWIMCCIAAAYGQETTKLTDWNSGMSMEHDELDIGQGLAIAHLRLCLRLGLPLVVVITKYDLARKQGLKRMLSRILDSLKASGRIPHLLRPSDAVPTDDGLQYVPEDEIRELRDVFATAQSPAALVPILPTSAVTGAGVTKLHALLREIPVLTDTDQRKTPVSGEVAIPDKQDARMLFNIDEIFAKQIHNSHSVGLESRPQTFVLSGLIHRGSLNIGDKVLLGPFSEPGWITEPRPPLDGRRAVSYPITDHEMAMRRAMRFGPRRRRSSEELIVARPDLISASQDTEEVGDQDGIYQEWYKVRIISIRNLRLPVQSAHEGQATTVGVALDMNHASIIRPRKGMVLIRHANCGMLDESESAPTACGAFQIRFDFEAYDSMEPGARFFVYIATIRAQVKVMNVGLLDVDGREKVEYMLENDGEEDVFRLDAVSDDTHVGTTAARLQSGRHPGDEVRRIEVMFQLLNSREYIETGAKALVMPEQAGDNGTGLDGFAGIVSVVHP